MERKNYQPTPFSYRSDSIFCDFRKTKENTCFKAFQDCKKLDRKDILTRVRLHCCENQLDKCLEFEKSVNKVIPIPYTKKDNVFIF